MAVMKGVEPRTLLISFWPLVLFAFDIRAVRSDVTPQEWRQKGLEIHNDLRTKFDAPPLKMDLPWLCELSQEWADLRAANKVVDHRGNRNGSGENIYTFSPGSNTPISPGSAIYNWYTPEVGCFDPDDKPSNTNFATVAHFTQIVWSSTTSMCMSYSNATLRSGLRSVVVANYFPAGNGCGGGPVWCGVNFKTFPNGTRMEDRHRKGPVRSCFHVKPGSGDKNDGMGNTSENSHAYMTSWTALFFLHIWLMYY